MGKVVITLEDSTLEDGTYSVTQKYESSAADIPTDERLLEESAIGIGLAIKYMVSSNMVDGVASMIAENVRLKTDLGEPLVEQSSD